MICGMMKVLKTCLTKNSMQQQFETHEEIFSAKVNGTLAAKCELQVLVHVSLHYYFLGSIFFFRNHLWHNRYLDSKVLSLQKWMYC